MIDSGKIMKRPEQSTQ